MSESLLSVTRRINRKPTMSVSVPMETRGCCREPPCLLVVFIIRTRLIIYGEQNTV